MSTINVEKAIIKLQGNESLTDELRDDAAIVLRRWAESKIPALAARHSFQASALGEAGSEAAEDAFDEDFKQFRHLVRAMNRFAGRRAQMSVEEQNDAMTKIDAYARATGFKIDENARAAFLKRPASLDAVQNVEQLIALVDPPAGDTNTESASTGFASRDDSTGDTETQRFTDDLISSSQDIDNGEEK